MTTLVAARTPATPPPPVTVNGEVIAPDAIAREIQYHPSQSVGQSWREAAQALVIRALLLQEARRLGIVAEPRLDGRDRRETEDEATIRALVEREVRATEPTEAEMRRYYAANRERFRAPDIAAASHILVAARADDADAYAAARRAAEAICAELAVDPGRFAALAKAHSDCASAAAGGELGQLDPAETTPEFAAALAALGEGEVTPQPVAARYGFHVIHLERRVDGAILPFEAVSERIAAYLGERVGRTAMARYVAGLVAAADITGVELEGPALA